MVKILGEGEVLTTPLRGVVSEHKIIRVAVLPPGAKAAYVGAEKLKILGEYGLKASMFDYILTGSAGTLNGLAFKAGQQAMVPGVYRHLANKPWYFPARGYATFHQYLFALLRGEVLEDVRLDMDAALANPAKLLVAVSDLSGQIGFHEVLDACQAFDLAEATSAILPFSLPRKIDGKAAIDGAYAHGHCEFARLVRKVMREHRDAQVHVLFLANRPLNRHQHVAEQVVFSSLAFMTLFWSRALLSSVLAFDDKIRRSERLFDRTHRQVKLCALYPEPDEQVYPWETSSDHMHAQGQKIRSSLCEKLDLLLA